MNTQALLHRIAFVGHLHAPLAGSQVWSVGHTLGEPALQTPALHVSPVVHMLPSLQAAVLLIVTQPFERIAAGRDARVVGRCASHARPGCTFPGATNLDARTNVLVVAIAVGGALGRGRSVDHVRESPVAGCVALPAACCPQIRRRWCRTETIRRGSPGAVARVASAG